MAFSERRPTACPGSIITFHPAPVAPHTIILVCLWFLNCRDAQFLRLSAGRSTIIDGPLSGFARFSVTQLPRSDGIFETFRRRRLQGRFGNSLAPLDQVPPGTLCVAASFGDGLVSVCRRKFLP